MSPVPPHWLHDRAASDNVANSRAQHISVLMRLKLLPGPVRFAGWCWS